MATRWPKDILEMECDYFEFHKCTPRCSDLQMDEAFLARLRDAWRIYPFKVNSAYRSPEWERKHGRSGTSAHTLGKAVDIATPDSITRFYVFDALRRVGFSRFGFGKAFIHVDNDVCHSRPDNCIFLEFDR